MARKGFLLVLMSPPIAFDEEFNAWYDLEHLPERMSVPGFERAKRFSSVGPAPRYLAIYDLARFDVLESDAYKKVGGPQSSPWTKRVTARARVYRSAGDQIYPGNELTPPCARVELLRFRGVAAGGVDSIVAGIRKNFEEQPQTVGVRVFAFETANGVDVLGYVAGAAPAGPIDVRAFGAAAASIDLVNSYVPLPPP